ncbi:MAG: Ig-like domain repeat protein [Ignavibacteriales bacterium]|nr:Ig-like domain repeat protein [Ignavibacteriales bacterium]
MRNKFYYALTFLVIISFLFALPLAANQYRSKASGSWSIPATWSISTDGGSTWADAVDIPGTAPTDSIYIRDTHIVAINSTTTVAYVKVGEGTDGILEYDGVICTLTVTGNIDVLSGASFSGPNTGTITTGLVIGGDVTNSGTFNMFTGTGRVTDVTFNKNGNQTFSGSGSTIFNKITLNMGTSKTNILDMLAVFSMTQASASATITLTNGTFKISSASTIRPFGGSNFTIGATSGYVLNHTSAVSQWGNNSSLIVNGDLIINNGTMTISSTGGGNRLEIGATGQFTMNSGLLTMNGRITSIVAGGIVTISGGTVAVAAGGTVGTGSNSIFEIANSTFSMSNGTVSIASSNINTALPDVNINQIGNPITGGTFLITIGSVTDTITVSSNVPFYNFQVQNGTAPVLALLRNNNLQVQNNLTITSGTLDANNRNISVGGNWSNSGSFINTGSTVTFNGASSQVLTKSGGETFNYLTINKSSGTITLGNAVTVSGNLDFTSGTFDDGGNIVTVKGDISNSALHTGSGKILLNGSSTSHTLSGTGTYSNLELNDPLNASLSSSPTINGSLTLTSGTLTVGLLNTLTIGNGGSIVQTSGLLASGSNGGTFVFNGSGTVSGNVTFNNVSIAGAVDFGTSSFIGSSGILTINSGGSVNTNPPTYNSGSTLKYNSGGTFNRGSEWSSVSGAGYPANVLVSNGTTLDLGYNGASVQRMISENLEISSGSILSMSLTPMTAKLVVNGNIINDGTLHLSTLSGGDVSLFGNITCNGTITSEGRFLIFSGGNAQHISKSSGVVSIDYISIEKNSGSVLLDNDLDLLAPSSGDALQFNGSNDVLDLSGKNLTINGSIGGTNLNGSLKGSSSSNLIINGSGSFGTLKFLAGNQLINNLTINRTSSGNVQLGSDLTINDLPTLSNGIFNVGANTLSFDGSPIAGTSTNLVTSSASNLIYGGTTSGLYIPSSIVDLNNLTINNASNVDLNGNITIGGSLSLLSGDLITSSNSVTLGASAAVSETPNATVLGNLTTTRNITATSGTETFGNIGSDIILNGTSIGSTTVLRKTGVVSTGNSNSSIKRYFDISPTTNSGLNASVIFHYDDSELNGQDPATLHLYKSTDVGTSWTNRGGVVNTSNKTVTLSGISGFSRWTASNDLNILGSTPVPVLSSISPDSKFTGESGFTLAVNGTDFVDGQSVVRFNGNDRSTTFINETQLTAIIPATDLVNAGTFPITVFNNGGGGSSSSQSFTVNKALTTTSINSSINPTVYGQTVTFTANVSVNLPGSGIPTGTVTFKDGASTIGSTALDGSASASLSLSTLNVSTHSISAEYSGDLNYQSSISSPINQDVNKASTATSLTSDVNPSVKGQSIILTASVSAILPGAGIPSGAVTFKNGGSTIDTKTLDGSGLATLAINDLTVGSHLLTAEYNGDSRFNTSISPDYTQIINKVQTTTSLTSNLNPSVYGQSVSFTATVAVTPPGAATPTGTILFKDGLSTIGSVSVDLSGQAVLSITTLIAGSHSITAEYSGDGDCNVSTSNTVAQVVDKKSTTGILSVDINSSIYLDAITLKDSVIGSVPDGGTVQFKDGVTNLGSPVPIDLNGVALLTISTLAAGTHSITAEYGGTVNYEGNISNTLNQVVQKRTTTSYLTSSKNPSDYGELVTFRDSVAGSIPDGGTVQFKDGVQDIGSPVPLDAQGVATYSATSLSSGTHTITAIYSGTSNFETSSSNVISQVVNQGATVSILTSSKNPSEYTEAVTFKDSITGPVPDGGTVQFRDGGINIGSPVPLDINGVATYTSSTLTTGTHNITAYYSGTSNFSSSLSNQVSQVVNSKSTSSILISTLNPSYFLDTLTFRDTVIGYPDGGTVQFKDGGINIGSPVPIDMNGIAELKINILAAGTHTITAEYSGTLNYSPSISNSINQVVLKKPTTGYLTTNNINSLFGAPVVLKDSVVGSIPDGGTVQFIDGTMHLGTPVPVDAFGVATLTVSTLSVGTHSITAQYSGSSNFEANTSNTITQNILKRPTTSYLSSSLNPSSYGTMITFKDSIVGSIPDGGTVQFKDGAADIGTPQSLDANGVATLNISSLSVGTHVISAVYSGTTNYEGSVSNNINQVVNPKSTVSILTSSLNPAYYGQSVTFKDSVVGSIPDGGTVQFKDNGANIGSPIPLNANGVATLTISNLSSGSHLITAQYSGTINYSPSLSNSITQIVNLNSTTSFLRSSLNPSVYGVTVTFTDSVYGSVPDGGTVQFKDGAVNIGSPVPINGNGVASISLSNLSVGTHSITAVYSGTVNYSTSTSNAVSQVVNKISTTSYITSSLNPSWYGMTIVLKDSIYNSKPDGGTVQFKDNGTNLGSPIAININGVAQISVNTLTAGTHNITAEFSGNTNYAASTSNTIIQVVNQTSTTSILTSSKNPSVYGEVITLHDSVLNTLPGAGTVQFKDGLVNIGPPIYLSSASTADLNISGLSAGTHNLTAYYSGAANFSPSTSNVIIQVVNKKPTTSILTSSDTLIRRGDILILRDTVYGSIPDGGSVQFADGVEPLGVSVPLDGNGIAELSISTLSFGPHVITATYSGTSNYIGSVSNPVTVTVGNFDEYRSFSAESLALSVDNKGKAGVIVKKKSVRTQFTFNIACHAMDATGLQLEFSSGIDPAYPLQTDPPSNGAAVDTRNKRWDFVFYPPLAVGQNIRISGYSNDGKLQKIAKYFWKKYGLPSGYIVKNPIASMNVPKLPMPNRINVLAETFLQGGYLSTNGMIIGKNRKLAEDSSKFYSWYQTTRYGDVVKTMYESRVAKMHTGLPKGFDYYLDHRIMKGNQKLLPPTKYNNVLLADMIALKLGIVASAMSKTPIGFGELIYDNPDDTLNPYNGKMIKELAAIGDSLMMGYYENGKHMFADSSTFYQFDDVIQSVNLAFEGDIDTLFFADSLVLRGTNMLVEIPFLKKDSSIIPAVIVPINNLYEEIPESFTLSQNYPNPFNPITTIEFYLPYESEVILTIHNILGQQVAQLINGDIMDEGTHQFDFYPNNLASGVYFYRLAATSIQEDESSAVSQKFVTAKKMILLK